MDTMDMAKGPFLGGDPNTTIDLPITLVFLVLFPLGAITHMSIYRANLKRGHKFLFSSTVFEFCMVRTATCIMRIVWIFVKAPAVILVALIFQFGGASILYVLGIFFIQRIIRAMHPVFGWTSFFRFFTMFLAFTVVANILYNIVSLCVAFVSTDNPERFESALNLSKAGAIWNLLLVLYPLVPLLVASWIPGPRIEPFGYGPFRIKVAILVTGIVLLAVGTSIRLAEAFDRIPPGTEHEHPLYSKAVFYTTHFVFEILVVFLYAVARIDLRYHVPDGCTGSGDYSALSGGHEEKKWHSTKGQKGAANRQQPCGSPAGFRPALRRNSTSSTASSIYGPLVEAEGLPPRPRVSMRRSFVAAMGPVHRKSGGESHRKRLPSSTAAGVASPSQTELTGWIREVANLDMDHMASSSTMVPLKGEDGNSEFGG